MSIDKNVQIVKNFLAALGRRDKQGLLALSAEDIEWIIPGEDWPLAGTHRRLETRDFDLGIVSYRLVPVSVLVNCA